MEKRRIIKLIFLSALIFFLIFSFSVLAQDATELETEYPEMGGIKPQTVQAGLPEYVKYIFNAAVGLSGLIAFGALVWAGFIYLSSAGQPLKMLEAKNRIISAFLGIVILISSYIILTNINPQLVIFEIPFITPPSPVSPPQPQPMKAEEVSLITAELPLGQAIEAGLWSKDQRTKSENLVKDNENFLNEEIKTEGITFERIADLNKYLKTLTDDCRCEDLTGLCTEPETFGTGVGCIGDPCEKVRGKIEKVLKINKEKIEKLLNFQKRILDRKADLEKELSRFDNVDKEMVACEEQTKSLSNLNEHLSHLNYFRKQGWTLATVKIPEAPPSKADPLTFYCSAGGTLFDYPYYLPNELSSKLAEAEGTITEAPRELLELKRVSCPVEIPLGEIVDKFRELAVLLIVRLEKLASLQGQMVLKIEEMARLVSKCTDKDCKINCACIPNPCFRCCSPVPCTICVPFCKSPCLQAVGGCSGVPCPREDIEKTLGEIKRIEDEIFKTIKEIKQIFPEAVYLLSNDEEPKNLRNIRMGMSLCYSSDIEEPTWLLLNCDSAIGNYGPSGSIIGGCHPRNFFCCLASESEIKFPWLNPPPSSEPAYSVLPEKYPALPEGEKGCPLGWLCDSGVKNYNQYQDASEAIKELLSCMRVQLDRIQQEKEIKGPIGRISSISDSRLYTGTCYWQSGPTIDHGCSHVYEVKYGKERVSDHYGGPVCRFEKKSYAVDFGDEENAEYIITAAKTCRADSRIIFRTPGHYDHIHIGIGQAEGCGGQ